MSPIKKFNSKDKYIFSGILIGILVVVVIVSVRYQILGKKDSQTQTSPLFGYAECMRNNGISSFPNPTDDEGISLSALKDNGIDIDSPAFKAATAACSSLLSPSTIVKTDPRNSSWEKITPSGDCQCADGSKFVFWTHIADTKKIVLFFDGGGVCWDAETCAFTSNSIYRWHITDGDSPAFQNGIFDFSNPDNPFIGYSFIYVPYCTGDVHLGNVTRKYSPNLEVEHKGFANGMSALNYLIENYHEADQLVIIGVSAGSVAAPIYAGLASDDLPHTKIIVFGDSSGAYPSNPEINTRILHQWGLFTTMPNWKVNDGLTEQDWGFTQFWIQAGLHDQNLLMARFDHAFDATQAEYMAKVGLDTSDLLSSIDANEKIIENAGVVLHTYIAPGTDHGVTSDQLFYTTTVNDVRLDDWIRAIITGEPLTDVHCETCTK